MAEKDKELTKALQKAKKSPRNFAIISKGPNVLKLIVDKKPLKSGDLKEAKKKYEGNAIVEGVVLGGEGTELVFQVREEPSVGENKLKKFISEETGLPLKPSFVVVQKLAEVPVDEEEESSESSSAEQATGKGEVVDREPAENPPAGTSAPGESPAPDAAAASRLMGALNSLSGAIKQAAAANPAGKQELLALVSRFQTQIKQADLDEAQASLAAIRELVATAVAASGDPARSDADQAADRAGDEAKRLMAELNGLAADIKTATAANPAAKADLVKMMTQFQAQVKSRELEAAQASLAGIREILAAASGDADSNEQNEAEETDGEELDLATALGNYTAARAQVIAQLGRLAAAIEATGHAQAPAALLEIKAVKANLTAKPDTPAAVQELERYLETDDVVADVDGPNPYGIEVRLQETLLAAVYDLSVCLS
jgi:hypothetical protein